MAFEIRQEPESRTELVSIRVSPSEKLALLREARKVKYKGNVSNLLRDLLASALNDKSAASVLADDGALVRN